MLDLSSKIGRRKKNRFDFDINFIVFISFYLIKKMSLNQNKGNDRRQQHSASRHLNFQHPQEQSQFHNLLSQQPHHSQSSPLSQSQPQHSQTPPYFDSQHYHQTEQPLVPYNYSQQPSQFSQLHYSQPSQMSNLYSSQPLSQYRESMHSQPYTGPSAYTQTPEENAYQEQQQYYHTTQSEYHTPDTNVAIPTRRGKEKATPKASHRKGWEKFEDIILARNFCNKTDTTFDTREAQYWGDITKMYNEDVTNKGGVCRETKSLQNRWHKFMRPQCLLYKDAYNKVMNNVKSGENHEKTMKRVDKEYMFKSPDGKEFKFHHCIDILMKCQKFCAMSTTGTYPTMDNVDLDHVLTPRSPTYDTDTPGSESRQSDHGSNTSSGKRKSSSESTTNDVEEVNSPSKSRNSRPVGVKKRKMQAKRRLESVPEGIVESQAAALRLRELELQFEQAKFSEYKDSRRQKAREFQLNMCDQRRALAKTPEEAELCDAQKKHFIDLYMEEDGAPTGLRPPGF